jgi:hypothetical protein
MILTFHVLTVRYQFRPPIQESPNEREAFGKGRHEEKVQSLESIKERNRIKFVFSSFG